MVQKMITDTTCKTYGEDWHAVKTGAVADQAVGQGNATMSQYGCCPVGVNAWNNTCIDPNQ